MGRKEVLAQRTKTNLAQEAFMQVKNNHGTDNNEVLLLQSRNGLEVDGTMTGELSTQDGSYNDNVKRKVP